MRQSLTHYWRINLAVTLAAAIATAVLTGALLVGDSVKGSLRDLTLDRLGEIDYVLVRQDFFREGLTLDLMSSPDFRNTFDAAAPAILLNGSAVHGKSGARASRINIIALDERFAAFYNSQENDPSGRLAELLRQPAGQVFPSIVINQSLQNELQAGVGDQILLSFEKPSDIARGTLLGQKDTEDVVETVRLTLTAILPERGIGRFGLRPHQSLPLNAYVFLPVLQEAMAQEGKINAIAVSQKSSADVDDQLRPLQAHLHGVLRFEELGLKLIEREHALILESVESILSPQLVELTRSVVERLEIPSFAVYTYLANTMTHRGHLLPYSTVAALNPAVGPPFKRLMLIDGRPAPALGKNEILLNNWAASDLSVRPGDTLEMTYFAVGARDELVTKKSSFTVRGVVAMTGLAADRKLTPDFPGIADAGNMADWDPPFEVDLSLIRQKDEAYWDAYRGTPKAFVSLETGQALWGSRFGAVTSIRLGAPANLDLAAVRERFTAELLAQATPGQFNFGFQPVKAQGLASSGGATDFSGLFIGFSLFLIVSAALLVGMLFRLGVEQRSKEVGLLLAVGHTVRQMRRQLLQEGAFLAAIGVSLGLGGAVFYAWLMMVGLRTWWLAAVGSPFLFLHAQPVSLVTGAFISMFVILVSIWFALRKLTRVPPPALLAGTTTVEKPHRSARRAKIVAISSLILAVTLAAFAVAVEAADAVGLFFGSGTLVLISGLACFSLWLRGSHKTLSATQSWFSVIRMAARNSPRNPGRSMLSAALVACACFVIVAVEAFRLQFGEELLGKDTGTGGFSLVAQADIPLNYDLSAEAGRYALGFSDRDSEILASSEIIPFRFLPGDDASCLNLYQVERPRILGVLKAQIERGGFQFQDVAHPKTDGHTNSWMLLDQELEPNVIPAFGDYNSVLWILHSGLGKDFPMVDELGREIKLRFVGLFKKSIFQSELLISEENFLEHFPSQHGYGYYLIQTPPDQIEQHAQILEETLSDYGFDSSTTMDKLANFQAVENTYLSTFQTLGGLGLLLGTLGLGMVLIRNVLERRGELATLRAFGFKRVTLAWMVVVENGFMLALGIVIGTLSAVLAVAPHVLAGGSQVPWAPLAVTLLIVFLVGMLASIAAVSVALRIPLLPALRAE
ncbi:MAG: ABC transporter permease [bacterium]